MPAPNDPYVDFLRARADKLFYRLPYPGNAGDSLIQFATSQLLDRIGVRTTVDPRQANVILVPGGNPSMWPTIGIQRWTELWARYPQAEFVVGPAGFRTMHSTWAPALNRDGRCVTALFARDPDSYQALKSAQLRRDISCALSHDPALSLRDSQWLAAHRRAATQDHELLAFRNDFESNLKFPGTMNALHRMLPWRVYAPLAYWNAATRQRLKLRVSERALPAKSRVLRCDASAQLFGLFVEMIRASRTVHTDRLHVMLLAAMLGKRVFAYPTAHNKLEGVYRHSLADWADVTLVTM